MTRNLAAKFAAKAGAKHKVFADRKKAAKAGYEKHKQRYN